MIRFLVWDVDGTLLDSYPASTQLIAQSLQEMGLPTTQKHVSGLCSVSISHCVETLSERHQIDLERLHGVFNEAMQAVDLADQGPFPGVRDLCAYARSIGGANLILTHRDRTSLSALLAEHDMARWFVDIMAGDDGFPRKPDPTGLETLLSRNHVPKAETLMIGDRELDVLAAHAGGVRACFFGTNSRTTPVDFAVEDYVTLLDQIRIHNSDDGAVPS